MKSLLGPPLVAQLARKGLWNAGSRGNRQEMFAIRGFPLHKLPRFQAQLRGEDTGSSGGRGCKSQPLGPRQEGLHLQGPLGPKEGSASGM